MGTLCREGCERYLGYSILELVLRRLREAGFTADVAFPGQKYPQINGTVATVHIEKVDRAGLTVTVEVNIIAPAALGGTACEVEALRATEILRWSGAVCIQHGCSYDGVAQVYVVPVMATFTGITEADSCDIGPGFKVYINGTYQPFVLAFRGEETTGYEAEYGMGVSAPGGIGRGKVLWQIQLEELIPAGSPESEEPAGNFEVKLVNGGKTEWYYHCRWTSIQRTFSQEGLRKIRKGISMDRAEALNGLSEL